MCKRKESDETTNLHNDFVIISDLLLIMHFHFWQEVTDTSDVERGSILPKT